MGTLMLPELREQVWRANQAIVAAGLVTLSFGNASGVDRDAGVLLIKPSGFPYDVLRPEHLVAVSLADGSVVEGELRPSSDTPTHLLLYQRFASIGGVDYPVEDAWLADDSGGPAPTTPEVVAADTIRFGCADGVAILKRHR